MPPRSHLRLFYYAITLNIRSLSPPNKSKGVLIPFFTDTSAPVLFVFADTDSDTDTTHCTN